MHESNTRLFELLTVKHFRLALFTAGHDRPGSALTHARCKRRLDEMCIGVTTRAMGAASSFNR